MERNISLRSQRVLLTLDDDYNRFFYPNVCHLCKSRLPVTPCSSCFMISYCSEEHKNMHRGEHNEMCQALLTLFATRHDSYTSSGSTDRTWMYRKIKNTVYVRDIVQRGLETYEEQMIMHPRTCFSCRTRYNLVACCQDCYLIDACAEHVQELNTYQHPCDDLAQCFFVDMEYMIGNYGNKLIPSQYFVFNVDVHVDMPTFFQAIIRPDGRRNWVPEDYIYADDFTNPLTAVRGMGFLNFQKPQKRNHFVVHVIHMAVVDLRKLSAWEIFLHTFPKEMKLIVVIIMPKIRMPVTRMKWRCCKQCRENSKKLIFEFQPMLYHVYTASPVYRSPCVIYGFETKLHLMDEIEETAKAIKEQRCTVVLAMTTMAKGESDAMLLRTLVPMRHMSYKIVKNRYASLRPLRNYLNNTVCYANTCLGVIEW